MGGDAPEAADVISDLLPEKSPLYRDRIRAEVELLRGALLVTISEIGATPDVMPVVLAELETTKDPFTFGAACRVAVALGPRANAAEKYLLRPFGRTIKDELFSLDEISQSHPLQSPTTAQQEALKALATVTASKVSLPTLKAISEGRISSDVCSHDTLRTLALRAISRIESKQPLEGNCCCKDASSVATSTQLFSPSDRTALFLEGLEFTNVRGQKQKFGDLIGKPVFLSYFYTRCDNPQKCSRTVTTAAKLQRLAKDRGFDDSVRILLVTLDPTFDDSLRLREYGRERGFEMNGRDTVVRTSGDDLQLLCQAFDLPVSLNNGSLSIHGVGGILIDKKGRVAKRYNAILWNNEDVLADLKQLCEE
ncbi:MAG: SCO family protein [Pseudomonadota bacterium]